MSVEDQVSVDKLKDKNAALRATLSERYKKEKTDPPETESGNNDSNYKNTRKKITDIDTDVDESYHSLIELRESIEDVEEIRFEINDEQYTQWYKWNPRDKQNPLNQIVDYYTNGDISELVGERVFLVDINDDCKHIVHPSPYNTYTSHIVFEIYEKLYKIGNKDKKYAKTYINNKNDTVSSDTTLDMRLNSNGAMALGYIANIFILGITAIFSIFKIWSGVSALSLLILSFIIGFLAILKVREFSDFLVGFMTGSIQIVYKIFKYTSKLIKNINHKERI